MTSVAALIQRINDNKDGFVGAGNGQCLKESLIVGLLLRRPPLAI